MTPACIDRVRIITSFSGKHLMFLLALLLQLAPIQAQPSQAAAQPMWGKCSSAKAPAYDAAAAKSKQTVTKLADNVYVFRSPYFTNTLIVVGKEGVLVTDTHDDVHASLLKQEIAKITSKPVTKIVLSHEHFDHIGGTRNFAGAQIIAQRNILPFLVFDPFDRAPDQIDVTFDKELSIDMGTTQVELRYWGQTEGVANIVVHLPREKIALVSDLHYGDRSLVSFLDLSDTNMLGLRLALNEVSKWDLQYVVDAHADTTDPKALREYAGFMNDLHDAVYRVIEKEYGTVDSLELYHRLQYVWPDAIQLPKYQDWAGYQEEMATNVMWMASSILYGAL